MFERIKKWTDMDWIAYDPITDILGEVKGRSCAARQYLESMPVNNELFAISQYHDKVKVVHMYIDEEFVAVGSAGEIKEGLMSRGKERQEYDAPIEEVEAMVRHKNPDALVVIEPLSFCSTNEVQSWSCLGCIFEEVYADKMGYNMEKADRSQMNISDLL